MSQNRIDRSNRDTYQGGNPFVKTVLTTYQMKPYDNHIIADSTAAAFTVTLPPMAECAGSIFSVIAPEGNAQDTVTLVDKETATTIHSMDADDDVAVMYCTGDSWLTLYTNVA